MSRGGKSAPTRDYWLTSFRMQLEANCSLGPRKYAAAVDDVRRRAVDAKFNEARLAALEASILDYQARVTE